MHSTFRWAEERLPRFQGLLRQMVECESPSDDPEAVNRFGDLLADMVSPHAAVTRVDGAGWGQHLLCRWSGYRAGTENSSRRQVLVLAHGDTVWPHGTLRTMPFREADGRLWGPGVLDMKGGLCLFLMAMEAARELDLPLPGQVLLQVNSEEEVGSPTSRPLTEQNARESDAVLVLEPATGLSGKLKTERKGVGGFRIAVEGRAAHAGVDFEQGASAILELARQIERTSAWTDLASGVTVNPGVVSGGTRSNVVAAQAWVEVDMRVRRLEQAEQLTQAFKNLQATDPRCSLTITGGLNRPPLEANPGTQRLFRLAAESAAEFGLTLEESATGGGSDGNFTAALGVPTLDGLGCVGEGAHAVNESILLNEVPGRIAVLTGLLARLARALPFPVVTG